MNRKPSISASLEDYLEAIYMIIRDGRRPRVRDISEHLDVNMSSVTGALHQLADRNLVNYSPYAVVTLTEEGEKVAREITSRHLALKAFLERVLAVDESLADETACKMEHGMPREVVDRVARFVDFVESEQNGECNCLKRFHEDLECAEDS